MPTASDPPPLVVVLGDSGSIGSFVTASLAARPVRLRAVSRRPAPGPADGLAEVEMRSADMTDIEELRSAVDGADAVVHLIAPGPDAGVIAGLLDALATRPARSEPPAVIYAGSITQVGVPPHTLLDGTETDQPETDIARDKHAAERALLEASANGAVRGVSVRLPTVFGHNPATGRFDSGVLTAMIDRAIAGDALTMWHDGTVQRDLLHVRDAAAALLAALDNVDRLAGGHWLAGTGVGTPLGEAFRAIADTVARRAGTAAVPVASVPPPRPLSASDVTSAVVDPSAFRSRTGWAARVPLRNGLEWTVAAALAARSDRLRAIRR
jgi:nucleoside-diphosphate-sugar epimerase